MPVPANPLLYCPLSRRKRRAECNIRDVCKGADAVKAAGNEYLPFLDPSDKSARNKKRNALRANVSNIVIGHQNVVSSEIEKAGRTIGNCFTMKRVEKNS
jgi:hypothetical protein